MKIIVKMPGEGTGHMTDACCMADIERILGGNVFRIRMDTDSIFMNRAGWAQGMKHNLCHPVWGAIMGPIAVAGNDSTSFKDCSMDLPQWAEKLQAWKAMSAG